MAKQVIVSTGATATFAAGGTLADGAIAVQKMSSNGPTALALGDSIADAPQIRIVQGTAGANIYSPWIYGKDVINWSARSYTASAARQTTDTISALTATAAGEATFKVREIGVAGPGRTKSWTYSYAIGETATNIADGLKALIAADQADWVNCSNTAASNDDIVMVGYNTGATMGDGLVNEGAPTQFETSFEDVNGTDAARSISAAINAAHTEGAGMAYRVKELEEVAQGAGVGYYYRRGLPKTPDSYVVLTDTYDMYSIVATKDGSSASQIHGVDNLIELSVALKTAQAGGLVFENILNQYFASVGFDNVVTA